MIARTLIILCIGSLCSAEDKGLSADRKLAIRDAEVQALKAREALSVFMVAIQAQVAKMPEFIKLSGEAEKTAGVYAAAIKAGEESCKCTLDVATLVVRKDEPKPKPTPPAAKPKE